MGVGLGQGLVAFLSGVQEGAEKIDEKMAANMKRIQESNPDENLKSKYAAEYAKFDKDKELIASINALGGSDFSGISTAQGQVLAGGYKSIEEYQKALTLNPDLRHSMPKIGQEPIFTPSTYGLSNIKKDGTTRTTLSKTFNKLFRPEVFDENQSYADTQTDTKGSLTFGDDSLATTYRRGKSDNLSEDEVTSLKSVSNRNLAQNREKTKKVIKLDKNNVMQEYTLQRNDDGDTGFGAKALGGKLRPNLYEGYDVLFAIPWKDPTKDANDSVKEYTQELWTDKNGDLTGNDGFVLEGDKKLTYKTKIIKTGEEKDANGNIYSVEIGGGQTLKGWKYLQQDLIEATADKGTADRQNRDDTKSWLVADYELRKSQWDKLITNMGYAEGTGMNDHIANTLARDIATLQISVSDGRLVSKLTEYVNSGATNLEEIVDKKDESWDRLSVAEIKVYSKKYLGNKTYFDDVKDNKNYRMFIENETKTLGNVLKLSTPEALSIVELFAKAAIVNSDGEPLTDNWSEEQGFLDKFNVVNGLTFDQFTPIHSSKKGGGDFTVNDVLYGLIDYHRLPSQKGKTAFQSAQSFLAIIRGK